MKLAPTSRGFTIAYFTDASGDACSIQESSAFAIGLDGQPGASNGPYLWLGMNAGTHVDGECLARMHLTQELAAELIPLLQHFVETGRLPLP